MTRGDLDEVLKTNEVSVITYKDRHKNKRIVDKLRANIQQETLGMICSDAEPFDVMADFPDEVLEILQAVNEAMKEE